MKIFEVNVKNPIIHQSIRATTKEIISSTNNDYLIVIAKHKPELD